MKLNNVQSSSLETNANLDNENTIKCGIVNTSVITKFFRSSIYSNAIQTLTQEYVSNARDAHRDLDKDNVPIEVTLPTFSEPVLRIRDFGPGIDKEKMKNVFSLFGASTKRHSDRFTGGFGIGSKSALSYTDSFVLITYIDQIAYHYSIHINEDSDVEFSLLSEISALGYPNGTEIKIPVQTKDIDLFIKAVLRSTYFWETKPNLKNFVTTYDNAWYLEKNYSQYKLNIFEIVNSNSQLSRLFNNYRQRSTSGIVLVIDGIPYYMGNDFVGLIPEVQKFLDLLQENQLFVIKLNTGDCEIAGTREQISDSQFTKNKLKSLFQTLHDQLVKVNEDKHSECNNIQSFIRTRKEHRKNFSFQDKSDSLNLFTDKDSNALYRFSKTDEIESRFTPLLTVRRYSIYRRTKKLEDTFFKLNVNYPMFYADEGLDDAALKRKIKAFINCSTYENVVIIHKYGQNNPDDPTKEQFLQFCNFLEIKPFSEVKIEKAKSQTPRAAKKQDGTINIYRIGKGNLGNHFYNENFDYKENKFPGYNGHDFSKVVYTTSKNKKNSDDFKDVKLKNLGNALLSFKYILGVISEKSEKLIKTNPFFVKLEDLSIPEEIISGLKEEYFYNHNNFDLAIKLAPELDKIKDPLLKEIISKIKATKRQYISSDSIELLLKNEESLSTIKQSAEEIKKVLVARYPLLFVYYSYRILDDNKDELLFYLNAKFEKVGTNEQ